MVLTSNIEPVKDKDVASADPAVREAGIAYLTSIMKAWREIRPRRGGCGHGHYRSGDGQQLCQRGSAAGNRYQSCQI